MKQTTYKELFIQIMQNKFGCLQIITTFAQVIFKNGYLNKRIKKEAH